MIQMYHALVECTSEGERIDVGIVRPLMSKGMPDVIILAAEHEQRTNRECTMQEETYC